jgi:hypothetical protein
MPADPDIGIVGKQFGMRFDCRWLRHHLTPPDALLSVLASVALLWLQERVDAPLIAAVMLFAIAVSAFHPSCSG